MDNKEIPFFTAVTPVDFRWPIRVPVPVDGQYKLIEATGHFKWMSKEDAETLTKGKKEDGTRRTDMEICGEILLGVEGLKYADGTMVESSPELVARFLATNTAPIVTIATWHAALQGVAAEKN